MSGDWDPYFVLGPICGNGAPIGVGCSTSQGGLLAAHPRQLGVRAFPDDGQEALDGFTADKRMRTARLTKLQRVDLIQCFVVVRMDRQIDISTGFRRDILKTLDRRAPGSERFGQTRVIPDSIPLVAGIYAAPYGAKMPSGSISERDQRGNRARCVARSCPGSYAAALAAAMWLWAFAAWAFAVVAIPPAETKTLHSTGTNFNGAGDFSWRPRDGARAGVARSSWHFIAPCSVICRLA